MLAALLLALYVLHNAHVAEIHEPRTDQMHLAETRPPTVRRGGVGEADPTGAPV